MERPTLKTYCILFTPRSGSSWVADSLTKANRFGLPDEYFNPEFFESCMQELGANDIDGYVAKLRRTRASENVFGAKITVDHLLFAFGSYAHFFQHYPASGQFFFLIREDIVEQAVSLAKAAASSVYHSVQASDSDLTAADDAFAYEAGRIEEWLRHIHELEKETDRVLNEFGVSPIRMSYERLAAEGAEKLIARFARYLGVEASRPPETLHRKIGTKKNLEFARRFRTENASFMRSIDEERRARVARHIVEGGR